MALPNVLPGRVAPTSASLHSRSAVPVLQPAIPRPEHPRPDFQRERWSNLNGRWRFSFDPGNVGEQQRWYHVVHPAVAARTGEVIGPVEDPFRAEITVPFPWESRLSGLAEPAYKGAAWYQRTITVPADWATPADPFLPPPSAESTLLIETAALQPIHPNGPIIGPAGGPPTGPIGHTADLNTTLETPSPRSQRNAPRWRWLPYLCFGAVDWNAKVWVNGRFVTEHDGGYTPFAVDLSRYVRPGVEATLTVRVWDACDADTPLGKQVDEWYTHSGGIWQTVWLEARPAAHLAGIHITPHLESGRATFSLTVAAIDELQGTEHRLTVSSPDGSFADAETTVQITGRQTDVALEVVVPQPRAWSPEDPHLYDCGVTLTTASPSPKPPFPVAPDRVATYFGLRSVSTGRWEGRTYEYVFLNGEPVYLRGVLDQAFHPEALHSYPSDDVLRNDLQAVKDLGLNMVRCHIKINDPRYYYWCDKLGLLVMYDFPSASIYTPRARHNWEQTFRDALARDYSHPSIFAWILFNETWGLEEHQRPEGWSWVRDMFFLAKQLDPTRVVEDNSPYLYDHVSTDINTWHFYIGDYDRARRHIDNVVSQTFEGSPYHFVGGVYGDVQGAEVFRQGTQPLLNSEYAGISAWEGDRDVSYTFKFLTTELRRHDMICGYVYTELTDVEWEHNGFLNYDRTAKEFGYSHFVPGMTVADINAADVVGLDCPPCQTLPPGSTFGSPIFVSHWDRRQLLDARVRWQATAVDRFGDSHEVAAGERVITPRHYGVFDAGDLEVVLPGEPCLVTVALWLEDLDGHIRSRNYVNVDVSSGETRGVAPWSRMAQVVERLDRGHALRFQPGDFLGSSWIDPRLGPRASKFGATGVGWVDYAVPLPDDLDVSAVKGLRLRVEAAARTAHSRIDWKDPLHPHGVDYPQTEERKLPSNAIVWVNGIRLGDLHFPDDPADSRGVLSAHNSDSWESASYGFLYTLDATPEVVTRILETARGNRLIVRFEVPRGPGAGGINLYGARMGAYPIDPMILLDIME